MNRNGSPRSSERVTTCNLNYNKGSDATPDWTGSAISFSGSAGANELRYAVSGTGATGATSSASWPLATKPASGTSVFNQLWAFTADTTGTQTTYTGDNTVARVLRWSWDSVGVYASSPQWSCFDSSSHTAPSPGTQPSIVNGSSDTTNNSYMKYNAYGRGTAASGSTQDTPSAGSVGSAPTATTNNTNGSVSPPTSPAWLTTWQDAMGWLHYIVDAVTPQATFAGLYYWTCVLFFGANISASSYTFVWTYQYSWT